MKIILTLSLLFVFISGCDHLYRIKGNGNVITQERKVSGFENIQVSGAFAVFLTMGDQESITIETDENLFEYITTETDNGVLSISDGDRKIDYTKLKIFLTCKSLKKISLKGANSLKGLNDIQSQNLSLDFSGAGMVDLNLSVKNLDVDASGANKINFKGKSDRVKFNLAGATTMKCGDLTIGICDLSMSGAGTAVIHVTEELKISIAGAGKVQYKGEPKVIKTNIAGAGEVNKF